MYFQSPFPVALCRVYSDTDAGSLLYQRLESLFQNCELYLSTTHKCFKRLDGGLLTFSKETMSSKISAHLLKGTNGNI